MSLQDLDLYCVGRIIIIIIIIIIITIIIIIIFTSDYVVCNSYWKCLLILHIFNEIKRSFYLCLQCSASHTCLLCPQQMLNFWKV